MKREEWNFYARKPSSPFKFFANVALFTNFPNEVLPGPMASFFTDI